MLYPIANISVNRGQLPQRCTRDRNGGYMVLQTNINIDMDITYEK